MSCCSTHIDLGCVSACGIMTLPYTATESGQHTLLIENSGTKRAIAFNANIGEAIEIDMANFNESRSTIFQIVNPSGSTYTTTVDNVEYSCFKVKTFIVYGAETTTVSEEQPCCGSIILEVDGEETRTLQKSEWIRLGAVPTIEVFYNDGSGYMPIAVQPVFDSMPNPTEITITIPGIPSDKWYIKLS